MVRTQRWRCHRNDKFCLCAVASPARAVPSRLIEATIFSAARASRLWQVGNTVTDLRLTATTKECIRETLVELP
ncbi:hypothetical protein Pmani_008889 [Petrolisthes manimaculis]|uniref:Uncharacterized protein n=1 Tax=Petrolisthes manimaculis TaxID=1843537 RepID=A0AAE1UDH0_9EUCA|nr:hypothetical protein Pmani_008889 [Petrolisthes manimaculis]